MSGVIRLEPAHARVAAALHGASFDNGWSAEEFATLLEQPGVAGLMWSQTEAPEGGPCGFILIRAVADEAEILTLGVAPNFRRRGIAARLLDEACTMLRAGGTRRLFLEAAADNRPARALYESYGFRITGRRAAYYDRDRAAPADALIMTLDLAPPASSAPAHH